MPPNPPAHTISSRWTRGIVALAVAEGADEGALWAAAGVNLEELGEHIAEAAHLRMWEAVMGALLSPGFPIRVAEHRSVDEYAVLGLACKTAETVREALGHLVRFAGVWRSQYRCELRPSADSADSADLVLDGPTGDLGRRCTNESAVAQILKAIRDVTQVPIEPRSVSFRHPAPRDTSEHARFFECEVRFDAAFDGLTLGGATLDTTLSLADDALSRFLLGQLEALEENAATGESAEPLTVELRRAVSGMLPGGAPKLETVATKLAMSPRTLQRRLASLETTFAEQVDETRRHLALELIGQTDRPVGEVSFVLGFSEPSAFHRAFKRWTGTTPARFRRG